MYKIPGGIRSCIRFLVIKTSSLGKIRFWFSPSSALKVTEAEPKFKFRVIDQSVYMSQPSPLTSLHSLLSTLHMILANLAILVNKDTWLDNSNIHWNSVWCVDLWRKSWWERDNGVLLSARSRTRIPRISTFVITVRWIWIHSYVGLERDYMPSFLECRSLWNVRKLLKPLHDLGAAPFQLNRTATSLNRTSNKNNELR